MNGNSADEAQARAEAIREVDEIVAAYGLPTDWPRRRPAHAVKSAHQTRLMRVAAALEIMSPLARVLVRTLLAFAIASAFVITMVRCHRDLQHEHEQDRRNRDAVVEFMVREVGPILTEPTTP